MNGYRRMLEKISPNVIICYGKLFPEMHNDPVIVFPYNRHEHSEAQYEN